MLFNAFHSDGVDIVRVGCRIGHDVYDVRLVTLRSDDLLHARRATLSVSAHTQEDENRKRRATRGDACDGILGERRCRCRRWRWCRRR